MKRVLLITMAALTVFLTQCKKTAEVLPQPAADNQIHISVNVGGNSKVSVDGGEITFENDDMMYVASDGKYIGTLNYSDGGFSGTITNPKEGEELYFYFLGNKTPTETLEKGTTASLTVSIADQSSTLPVIACGVSDQEYSTTTTSYKTELKNKCGLVKFTADGYTGSGNITIKKMNNKLTVDLSKNLGGEAFSYYKENCGVITLNKKVKNDKTTEYWAILLPQDAEKGDTEGDAWSLGWKGIFGTVPAISNNNYVTSGVEVNLTNANAVFTVAKDKTVTFSPGLLYWDGGSFEFETYQTSFQPTANGTWNENHVNHFFWQPYSRMSNSYTKIYDGTSATDSDILFTNKQESGCENEPNPDFTVNGESNTWRALTAEEWQYMLTARAVNYKFAKAKVGDKNGLLIFPDIYSLPIGYGSYGGTGMAAVNDAYANFPGENIPTETWSAMEAAGVVFLPAAGYRYNETSISLVDSYGYCWSSSPYNYNQALMIQFENGQLYQYYGCGRNLGLCLRLVR